ncbi:MAG: 50S ribosomal protein L11 methyltransferase [Burkholderiaceae bacterium]
MFELSLQCPQQRVEEMADALEALGAQSVSLEDADALTDAESALFGEPGMPPPRMGWRHSRITALFATQDEAHSAARLLGEAQMLEGCSAPGVTVLADQDWVRLTQAQFAPVAITPTFWIVPSWHEAPAQAQQVIRLDPGLAFGTGTHPTTSMCLRWIATHGAGLGRVLDYGCGSGILGIAAALFGAAAVDAVDIDPAAVAAARLNAQANDARLRCGTPELAQGRYDTVVANILASPLKVLAASLCGHVAPGGKLALAGILERQSGELQEAYRPYAALDCVATEDGWVLMTATL